MLSPDGLVNEIHIDICDGYTHCDRICQFLQVPRDDRVCAPSCPRLFKSGWACAHPCPMASAPMIMAVYDFFCPYWSVVHDGERMVQKLKLAANIWQKMKILITSLPKQMEPVRAWWSWCTTADDPRARAPLAYCGYPVPGYRLFRYFTCGLISKFSNHAM